MHDMKLKPRQRPKSPPVLAMKPVSFMATSLLIFVTYELWIITWIRARFSRPYTLESGIDVGQGINVGPGKVGKKNKLRTLNTHVLCSK